MDIVSIILPTLNSARYLRQAIESCLNQTHSSIELIVVDGGSTDDTFSILEGYEDPRLRVLHQPNNAERLPGALNLGLADMKGAFFTWMQDDSMYAPEAIQRMVQFLQEHPEIGMVYTDYWRVDENGEILEKVVVGPSETLLSGDRLGVCFLYRRIVYETVGEYHTDNWLAQDYDYRLRVARRFPMAALHEPLYYWRVHPHSLTNRYGLEVARDAVRVRRKLGYIDKARCVQELAYLDVCEAFERYAQGDLWNTRRLLGRGILGDPSHLTNRGVLSILLESLIGSAAMRIVRQATSRAKRRTHAES